MAIGRGAGVLYGAPALTLGTTNTKGASGTALPNNSTVLVYDTTLPTVIGSSDSGAVGTATVAARRDHQHESPAIGDASGPSSSVDNSIARFAGTGGKTLQGYTSSSPTIDDLGKLEINEGQIAFPSTPNPSSDANTLDDYDEGEFSPAITFGGNSNLVTYSNQDGQFTKVGRHVYASFRMTLTSKGDSTGVAAITGLPFSVGAQPSGGGASLQFFGQISYVGVPFFRLGAGGSSISAHEAAENGAESALTNAEFANNSDLALGLHYDV